MEELDFLNRKLEDEYGRVDNYARYRIVWSTDEYEMRHGTFRDFLPEGIFLREVTEVRRVPKYKQWAPDVYILERITPYDTIDTQGTMIGKLGYEPLHTFAKLGKHAVPSIAACKYLIEVVIEGTKSPGTYVKYKDPEGTPEGLAAAQAEIDKIQEELFGNETDIGDALAHKEGVTVPDMSKVH